MVRLGRSRTIFIPTNLVGFSVRISIFFFEMFNHCLDYIRFVACNHAIIKVNDNYRDFVSDMTKVYTGISFTSHNTEYEYEFVEFLVPFVRCLLKPVEGLKKLTDVVLFSFHHEPLRLLHLDGFFMFGVQKCSFDIELCQFKIHGWCLGKEDFDCTLFRDGSECFVEVSILYCCRDSTTVSLAFQRSATPGYAGLYFPIHL